MVLAQPARLRPLIAEHGRKVIGLERHRLIEQSVLDKAAYSARGPLGLEGDRAVALVQKGIHLLVDDIGRIAHAA